MLCYRCGSHAPDGTEACGACGQKFAPGIKPGPVAGFGTGTRRHRIAVESAPFKPGDVIADRFEIRAYVGAGPTGWVYKCTDTDLDVDVAVKVFSPRLLQTNEEKRKLSLELRSLARLAHPNILRVYEDGEARGMPFFTMQHLEGPTLRRLREMRRQKQQPFSLSELEPLVTQLARALDHAHAQGLSHGALKPDNVVVLPDGVKLTDFGLANALPRAPFLAAQKAAGVHRYLAPEFHQGDRIAPQADVFSLGAIVIELLSGAAFEPGLSVVARNPALPAAVDALLLRATAARAADRFASAGELVEALSAVSKPAPPAMVAPPPPAPPVDDEREFTEDFDEDDLEEVTDAEGTKPEEEAPEPMPPPPPVITPKPPPAVAVKAEPRPAPAKPAPVPATVAPRESREPAWSRQARDEPTKILPTPAPVLRQESSSKAPLIVAGVLVAIIAAVFFYLAWNAEGRRIAEAGQAPVLAAVAPEPVIDPLSEPKPVPSPEPVIEPTPTVEAKPVEAKPVEVKPVEAKRIEPMPVPKPPPVPVRDLAREQAMAEAERQRREEEKRRQDEAVARLAAMHAEAERQAEAKAAAVTVVKKPVEPEPVVAKEPTCPAGMRLVNAGSFRFGAPDTDDLKNFGDIDQRSVTVGAYCIDLYEYPNRARGRPATGVTFTQAASSCQARGKRLCTEQEWERACKGPSNARFPYGKDFDGDACNTEDASGQVRVATFAGAYAKCVSGFGVFDLAGNVGEWVDAAFDQGDARKTVKGGAADRPDFATRCAARVGKTVATKDPLIGFRCCSDPL